jgi:Putative zinc-finger
MSRIPQLDIHPDADSLNAFVEHELPEPEHQQVLAHIAACGRCRQVVYLAQDAAADLEPASQISRPSPHLAKQRIAWFANWRFAWVSAAACSALVALSISIYFWHATPAQKLAKVARSENEAKSSLPDQPLPEPSVPKQALPRQASSPQAMSRQAGIAARSQVPPPISSGIVAKLKTPAVQANAAPQPSAPEALPAPLILPQSASATVALTPDNGQSAVSRPPLTATISEQSIVPLNQNALQIEPQQELKMQPPHTQRAMGGAMAKAATAGTRRSGVQSAASHIQPGEDVTLSAGVAPANSEVMYFGSGVHAGALSNADLVLARRAMRSVLPDGLTAVSTAAAQQHLLAVDATGAVFLSNDSGRNWESVVPQWTGRAIEVRANPVTQANQAANRDAITVSPAGKSAANAPLAKPAIPAFFEIVNDSASIWTSTDGKTWKAK